MSGAVHTESNAVWRSLEVEVEIPTDRFWLKCYDSDTCDQQVRLEPDGTVYLSYSTRVQYSGPRDVTAVTLSLKEFDVMFRKFVDDCVCRRTETPAQA